MKGYTDLEQSKKLAEILPVESADMFYVYDRHLAKLYGDTPHVIGYKALNESIDVPCWSLAALLDVLISKDFDPETMFLRSTSDGYGTRLTNVWRLSVDRLDVDINLRDIHADNLVDACYEMIIRLSELNLLKL